MMMIINDDCFPTVYCREEDGIRRDPDSINQPPLHELVEDEEDNLEVYFPAL